MYPHGITRIVDNNAPETDDDRLCIYEMGDSIAAVDKQTGTMYINRDELSRVKSEYNLSAKEAEDVLFFVMLHENAHLVLQSSNEEAVDEWAHRVYLESGRSLKNSVFAITRLLRFNKAEDYRRASSQLRRAQAYDTIDHFEGAVTLNEKIMRTPYTSYATSTKFFSREYPMPVTKYVNLEDRDIDLFIGGNKLMHYDNDADYYKALASGQTTYTPASSTPAKNDVNWGGLANVGVSLISNLFGKKSSSNSSTPPPPAPAAKDNTLIYIGGGLAAFVVIILIVLALKRK